MNNDPISRLVTHPVSFPGIEELVGKAQNIQPNQKTGQWQYTDNAVWDATEINDGQQLKLKIDSAKCSACDRWAEQVNKYTGYMTYNFCPYCGAKMKGEGKDDKI